MRKRPATIIDIANKLGYSIATVSRALNDFDSVKEQTKAEVLRVAKELNYSPNIMAKSLVKKKSGTIGCLFPDVRDIYYALQQIITVEAEKHGYHMIFYFCGNSYEQQKKYMDVLNMQQVEGFVICPIAGRGAETKEKLDIVGAPYVFFNRFIDETFQDKVLIDFKPAYDEALNVLIARGRKKMTVITHKEAHYPMDRSLTIETLLKEKGKDIALELLDVDKDDIRSGYHTIRKIFEGNPKAYDTIFCPSDFFAMGAVRALEDLKIEVPRDVSIIGCYSDDNFSNYTIPRITTVECNFPSMVTNSMNRLVQIIRGEDYEKKIVYIPSKFIQRETN